MGMLERLRQSLALRLAIQYALVFMLGVAVLLGALYWLLARALDNRERATLVRQTEEFADAFERGAILGLRNRVDNDTSPQARAAFVRLIGPDNIALYQKYPNDWVETQVQKVPLGPFTLEQPIQTVRIPQNALRDYTIATRQWENGWKLQVGRLLDSVPVLLLPLRRAFVGAFSVALLLSVAVGTLLAWRATRPLRAVSDTTRRILQTGDLSARVPGPEGSGELAVLVRQLNTLLEKNSEHVRVLRDTLDNLAHDMRTPLTRLRGTAELAMQDAGDPVEARAALADCVNESDRVLHLLETLLDISAAEAGALKLDRDRIDVRTLTDRAVDLYREVAEEKNITVTLHQPEPAELSADSIRLGQAINNLLDNALKYTPSGGKVTMTVQPEPKSVTIAVVDNGPGVPPHEREAIFRRLYRGDSSRSQRGLGLGLSMVKAIVEAHCGTVTVDDAPGGGARFTVTLPRK
jgi:signal transduction histidine kinase